MLDAAAGILEGLQKTLYSRSLIKKGISVNLFEATGYVTKQLFDSLFRHRLYQTNISK